MTEFNMKQALICMDLSDTDNVIFDYLNYVQLKLGIDNMFFSTCHQKTYFPIRVVWEKQCCHP